MQHFWMRQRTASASPTDGVHMEPEGHRALGEAIAKKIQEIFS